MKTLQEFLIENLEIINESFHNLKVYCVGRGVGPVTICKEYPTTDPYDSDGEPGEFDISDADWLYDDISNGTGNLAFIEWCDDSIYGFILNKVQDEKALRKEFDATISAYIEENGNTFEDIYIELPCGVTVDLSGDYKESTVDNLWKRWMKQFNDSYVDGDSGYCRCLVDLKKKRVIAGGSDINFEI